MNDLKSNILLFIKDKQKPLNVFKAISPYIEWCMLDSETLCLQFDLSFAKLSLSNYTLSVGTLVNDKILFTGCEEIIFPIYECNELIIYFSNEWSIDTYSLTEKVSELLKTFYPQYLSNSCFNCGISDKKINDIKCLRIQNIKDIQNHLEDLDNNINDLQKDKHGFISKFSDPVLNDEDSLYTVDFVSKKVISKSNAIGNVVNIDKKKTTD